MLHETMTEEQLTKAVIEGVRGGNFQEAAIAAFVLAKHAKEAGDENDFQKHSSACLACLKERKTNTLERCAHTYVRIAGVFIPELFHEESVLQALA